MKADSPHALTLCRSSAAQCEDSRVFVARPAAVVLVTIVTAISVLTTGCTRGVPSTAGDSPASDKTTTSDGNVNAVSSGTEATDVDNSATPATTDVLQPAVEPPKNRLPIEVTDAEGRHWFGTIPLDLFYSDTSSLVTSIENSQQAARKQQPLVTDNAGAPMKTPANLPNNENPSTKTLPSSADVKTGLSKVDWSAIITPEIIDAELKRLRNQLTDALRSVGRYNQNFEKIQVDSATLAALALIAGDSTGENRWKERAPFIAQQASGMERAADGRGRPAFEKTERHFQDLLVVLNGGQPTIDAPADKDIDWSDSASRTSLMRRMQTGFDWLQSNVNSDETIKAQKTDAHHETAILAALIRVVSNPSYAIAEEEDYQKHAAVTLSGLAEMQQGIEASGFTQYDVGFQKLKASCNACHQDYRF